jgi:hypothetical protein
VRALGPAFSIAEIRGVHHVWYDTRPVAVTGEDLSQVLGRHHDLMGEPQPGMDEETPPGQMIVRLSTVVVEDHALAQDARRGHGGRHREQEGPVRRREHLDDVCLPKT